MGNIIKPALLVLMPILNAIGQWLKKRRMPDGSYQNA